MKGLTAAELEELRACLVRVEAAPGVLFRRGEHGDSMYVVDRGMVEVRIGESPGSMRLAAFGPGSIFGEVAMLNAAARTADVVCTQPTRLYELRREALMALKARSPGLYARIIENLNAHLANRLVIATAIVQAHR